MLSNKSFKPFNIFFGSSSFSQTVVIAELSVSEELLPPSVKAESTKLGLIHMGQLGKSLLTTAGSLSEGTGTINIFSTVRGSDVLDKIMYKCNISSTIQM